jgi:hypothetical protein
MWDLVPSLASIVINLEEGWQSITNLASLHNHPITTDHTPLHLLILPHPCILFALLPSNSSLFPSSFLFAFYISMLCFEVLMDDINSSCM